MNLVQDVGSIGVVFRLTSANCYILAHMGTFAAQYAQTFGVFFSSKHSSCSAACDVGMTLCVFWPVDMNPKKVFVELSPRR